MSLAREARCLLPAKPQRDGIMDKRHAWWARECLRPSRQIIRFGWTASGARGMPLVLQACQQQSHQETASRARGRNHVQESASGPRGRSSISGGQPRCMRHACCTRDCFFETTIYCKPTQRRASRALALVAYWRWRAETVHALARRYKPEVPGSNPI